MPTVLKVEIGGVIVLALSLIVMTVSLLMGEIPLWRWSIFAVLFALAYYSVAKSYRRWKDPVVADIDADGRAEIAEQAKTDRVAAVKLARRMDPRLNLGEATDYVISVENSS